MKDACEKWKDQLLEAELTEATTKDLEEHLRACTICSRELDAVRARKAQLDELLPLVARGAEPPADFQAHVLAAAEAASGASRARRSPPRTSWRSRTWSPSARVMPTKSSSSAKDSRKRARRRAEAGGMASSQRCSAGDTGARDFADDAETRRVVSECSGEKE